MNEREIERIALENGFKLKEQPDGSMSLNPYVFQFAKALLAAGAPEGVPIYQFRVMGIEARTNSQPLWKDTHKEKFALLSQQDHPVRVVYPAPSDELRKAAEELHNFLTQLKPNMHNWLSENKYMHVMENLRAALEQIK